MYLMSDNLSILEKKIILPLCILDVNTLIVYRIIIEHNVHYTFFTFQNVLLIHVLHTLYIFLVRSINSMCVISQTMKMYSQFYNSLGIQEKR